MTNQEESNRYDVKRLLQFAEDSRASSTLAEVSVSISRLAGLAGLGTIEIAYAALQSSTFSRDIVFFAAIITVCALVLQIINNDSLPDFHRKAARYYDTAAISSVYGIEKIINENMAIDQELKKTRSCFRRTSSVVTILMLLSFVLFVIGVILAIFN